MTDGRSFRSLQLGISYFTAAGKSLTLAKLEDCSINMEDNPTTDLEPLGTVVDHYRPGISPLQQATPYYVLSLCLVTPGDLTVAGA